MATNHNALPTSNDTLVSPYENEKPATTPLEEAHERFGIDLNAPEIVQRTLENHGFTVLELDPPHTLPTVEEWITQRMAQGYAGYNHGGFVINEAEQIGFAKTHYGPANIQTMIRDDGEVVTFEVGGPKREADVLEALGSNGYQVPEVMEYSPASPEGTSPEEKTYELLVIEAVLPEYGAVRPREDWTPELARIAARKMATFTKPAAEIPLFENESIALPVEGLVEMLPRTGDAYDQMVAMVLETYPHLDTPTVVHGDTWFNNIIASHDDSSVMFVDWELAGPGYQGQDAGRKLWDLTLTNDWQLSEYSEAAAAFTDEWSTTADDRLSLEFGVVYESLRWIAERMRDCNDAKTDEQTLATLYQEITDVKAHALTLLSHIAAEQ